MKNTNYKSIFRQFIVPIMLIVVLLVVIIISEIHMVFTDSHEQQIKQQNLGTSVLIAEEVQSFMELAYRLSEELSVSSDIVSMQTEKQTPVLEASAERNDFIELYYIQGMDGMQTGRSSGELADRSTRWWFQQMMETKQPFISQSYYSINTNMPCASVFLPVEKDGEMIGVFATDIKLTSLQRLIEESSDHEAGKYSFIVDGEGVVVAHPDSVYLEELYNYKELTKTVSMKDSAGNVLYDTDGNIKTEEQPLYVSDGFKQAVDDVMAGKQGYCKVEDEEGLLYISYAPVELDGKSASWSVLTVQTESSAMAIRDRIVQMSIASGVVMLIIALLFIFLLTKRITAPIRHMRKMTESMAQGNFDEVSDYHGNNEINAISDSLNQTAVAMREIIEDITVQLNRIAGGDFTSGPEREYRGSFAPVASAIRQINDSLNQLLREIRTSSEQVAFGAQEVSNEAGGLADGALQQDQLIRSLEMAVDEISAGSRENEEKAMEGKRLSEETMGDISRNQKEMGTLVEAMRKISEMSGDISRIVKVIDDISFQTNILALNAAVEAAHAGSSGKGFAVVAEEVRNLATKSADATKQTAELIEETVAAVNEGAKEAEMAAGSLERVVEKMVQVDQYMSEIAANSGKERSSVENISENIDGIANVVAENARSAQNSALSSQNLNGMSDRMFQLIGKFRLK